MNEITRTDAFALLPPCAPNCPNDLVGLTDFNIKDMSAQIASLMAELGLRRESLLSTDQRQQEQLSRAAAQVRSVRRTSTVRNYSIFLSELAFRGRLGTVKVVDTTAETERGRLHSWLSSRHLSALLATDLGSRHKFSRYHVLDWTRVGASAAEQSALRIIGERYTRRHDKWFRVVDLNTLSTDLSNGNHSWSDHVVDYMRKKSPISARLNLPMAHPILHLNFAIVGRFVYVFDQQKWTARVCANPDCVDYFERVVEDMSCQFECARNSPMSPLHSPEVIAETLAS